MTGLVVLAAAVLLALGFGLFRARTDGRFRTATPASTSVLAGTPYDAQLGERATLLQFSSAFCAPCRATRTVLADVAGREDGVAHLEVDAEAHLDLVRQLGILRTPTTLVLDASGAEVLRASGVPTRDRVRSVLPA